MGSCIGQKEHSVELLKKFFLSAMKNKNLLKSILENEAISPLDIALQEEIVAATVGNPLCKKFPTSISYQKFFLHTVIDTVEAYGSEICNSLIEEYANVLLMPSQERISYCSYIINDNCTISLQENPCFVAKSTTGLQTWEASKYLCEWSREYISIFENKTILELGSGVGLLGLTILKLGHPSTYIFSDKSWEVLNVLSKNIALNFDEKAECPVFDKLQLVWSTVCEDDALRIAPDIILGADLVYDPDMVESLVYAIKTFLVKGSTYALLANVVRNTDTSKKFITELGSAGLAFEVLQPPLKSNFIYNNVASFILYKVYVK